MLTALYFVILTSTSPSAQVRLLSKQFPWIMRLNEVIHRSAAAYIH